MYVRKEKSDRVSLYRAGVADQHVTTVLATPHHMPK